MQDPRLRFQVYDGSLTWAGSFDLVRPLTSQVLENHCVILLQLIVDHVRDLEKDTIEVPRFVCCCVLDV